MQRQCSASLLRFIPAGAGNAARFGAELRIVAVHPRWRGERAKAAGCFAVFDGSSPLARGTPGVCANDYATERFIPAGAGNAAFISSAVNASTVHPRWRGERAEGDDDSPGDARFIPAGAGNASASTPSRALSTVHPRWRGERLLSSKNSVSSPGSSPLARGTLYRFSEADLQQRFIPAGAGNAGTNRQHRKRPSVHPRWRGERARDHFIESNRDGSSPLARGTRVRLTQRRDVIRFIPAGAGNASISMPTLRTTSVHPRWRGERSISRGDIHVVGGSSPLARGTPPLPVQPQREPRFIPAGAGNASRLCFDRLVWPVHPRWRGERVVVLFFKERNAGSSPLARGTRHVSRARCAGGWFIPAGAGNAFLWSTTDAAVTVHPRWRGERS